MLRSSKPLSDRDLARPIIFLSIFAKSKTSPRIANVTKLFCAIAFGAPGDNVMIKPRILTKEM